MTAPASVDQQLNDSAVVKKAVRATAAKLGLSLVLLSEVTGVRREVFSRERERLGPKQIELCLLVIRVARSLSALLDGNDEQMKHWIKTENRAFNATPLDMMKSVQGLARTVQYLDGMRAKI